MQFTTKANKMETIEKTPSLCDVCNKNIDSLPGLSAKYDELYLSILQIGQRRENHGISYNYLLSELNKKGFDVNNGCIDLAIKHWFCSAYYHAVDKGKFCNVDEIGDHSSCSFILKAESSLLLLEHEKISKTIKLAWIAIITALAIGLITIGVTCYLTYHPMVNGEKKDVPQEIKIIRQTQVPILRRQ